MPLVHIVKQILWWFGQLDKKLKTEDSMFGMNYEKVVQ